MEPNTTPVSRGTAPRCSAVAVLSPFPQGPPPGTLATPSASSASASAQTSAEASHSLSMQRSSTRDEAVASAGSYDDALSGERHIAPAPYSYTEGETRQEGWVDGAGAGTASAPAARSPSTSVRGPTPTREHAPNVPQRQSTLVGVDGEGVDRTEEADDRPREVTLLPNGGDRATVEAPAPVPVRPIVAGRSEAEGDAQVAPAPVVIASPSSSGGVSELAEEEVPPPLSATPRELSDIVRDAPRPAVAPAPAPGESILLGPSRQRFNRTAGISTPAPLTTAPRRDVAPKLNSDTDSSEEDDDTENDAYALPISVEVITHKFYLSAVAVPVDPRAGESCAICRVCLSDPPLGATAATANAATGVGNQAEAVGTASPGASGNGGTSPGTTSARAHSLSPATAGSAHGTTTRMLYPTAATSIHSGASHTQRPSRTVSPNPADPQVGKSGEREGRHSSAAATASTSAVATSAVEDDDEAQNALTAAAAAAAAAANIRRGIGGLEEGEVLVSTGACGHTFHTRCVEEWRETKATCPLCDALWVEPDPPVSLE